MTCTRSDVLTCTPPSSAACSVLGDLARRCPALPKYLQHKAFAADSQHKQRGRRARRQVAGEWR